MMVEVFKTNVSCEEVSMMLTDILLRHFPGSRISFDLEDCDRVLRIEQEGIIPGKVIEIISTKGYHCEILL